MILWLNKWLYSNNTGSFDTKIIEFVLFSHLDLVMIKLVIVVIVRPLTGVNSQISSTSSTHIGFHLQNLTTHPLGMVNHHHHHYRHRFQLESISASESRQFYPNIASKHWILI